MADACELVVQVKRPQVQEVDRKADLTKPELRADPKGHPQHVQDVVGDEMCIGYHGFTNVVLIAEVQDVDVDGLQEVECIPDTRMSILSMPVRDE